MKHLTDPQFRVLTAAADRGDNLILRSVDASESTLRSLARHHIAELRTEMVGRRKVVVGAYVTFAGWLVWSAESDRREQAAQAAANARIVIQAQPDPFEVHTSTVEFRRDAAIDAAFAC